MINYKDRGKYCDSVRNQLSVQNYQRDYTSLDLILVISNSFCHKLLWSDLEKLPFLDNKVWGHTLLQRGQLFCWLPVSLLGLIFWHYYDRRKLVGVMLTY